MITNNNNPHSPLELLCFGNAIVDVFASVYPAWLDELKITEPVQHISRDLAQKILEAFVTEKDTVIGSGGTAANVAKIAAMLDTKSAFAGCVGSSTNVDVSTCVDDLTNADLLSDVDISKVAPGGNLAAIFKNDLEAAGVTPLLSTGKEKTGLCFAFNCGEFTRIAASPGAALEFSEADVPADLIPRAEALVLDGYMLDRRPLVRHIMELASRHGIPIALDAASVFQIKEKTEDILQYSRNYPLIVFMNADEAIVFYNNIRKSSERLETSGEREKETMILKEICPVLKCITEGEIFPIIVIKLGGRGAVVLAGGNIYREETFTIIPRNTVGAGDAFCAAFMSAWIRHKSIQECAALGNKVAREILLVPGTNIEKGKLRAFAKQLRK
jgi:sugar/nucleoside kinase (ribokinase family)